MFLSIPKLSLKLGISRNALKRIIFYGKLKAEKINDKQCYDPDEVIRVLRIGKEFN